MELIPGDTLNKLAERHNSEKAMLESGQKPAPLLKNRVQRVAIKALGGFFAAMLGFTLLSRSADGIAVARVTYDTLKSGVLTDRINLNGSVEPLGDLEINLPGNIRVTTVQVSEGQKVNTGDVLMELDAEDVAEQLEKLNESMHINELKLESAQSGISESDSSSIASAQASLAQAQADYERLKEKLDRSLQRNEDDLLGAEEALENASEPGTSSAYLALEQAKDDYDRQKEKTGRNIKRAEEDLQVAEKALVDAQLAYIKAVEKAKDDLTKSTADKVESTNSSLVSAKEQAYSDISNSLKSYENAPGADVNAITFVESALTLLSYSWDSSYSGTLFSARDYLYSLAQAGEPSDLKRARENLISTLDKNERRLSDAYDALKDAEQEQKDLRSKTDFTDQQGVISAQNAIDSAQRSVNSSLRSLEDTRQNAQDQLLSAERAIQNAEKNLETSVESAEKSVNSAKRSMEDAEQSADDQLLNAERAIDTARRNLDQARKQAGDNARNNDKTRRQTEIDALNLLSEKRELEKSIAELTEISEMNGLLRSPIDGTVLSVASRGKTQDGAIAASISRSELGFNFEANVDESAVESLSVGDSGMISYTSEGKGQNASAVVTAISGTDENGKVTVSASLPDGAYPAGVSAEFSITRRSEKQSNCLPLSALRSDSDGDYVLALREKKTVMGLELTAERIPVTVSGSDSELISIYSALMRDDRVITSSNKPIYDGDRVRLEED